MSESGHSLSRALLAGIALGAIALVGRYAPPLHLPKRPDRAVAKHLPKADPPAAEPSVAAAPATLPDRFASPEILAACPSDMALVEGEFCPDLELRCLRKGYGHGCAEYQRGAVCHGKPDPRRYCVDKYEWPNKIGENPLVYVDWHEAKDLCDSVDKRLCRRSEWMLACEGPKRMPYPYGFVRQPSPCNMDRTTIPFDVGAMIKEPTREEELARLWQADKIGSHPDCVSAFGAFDMSGNVDEWTDDQADDPGSPNVSTLNGGYWGPLRDTCRLATTSHGPTFKFYQVGFRCCADTIDDVETPPPRPWIDPANLRKREKKAADAEEKGAEE